MGCPLQSRTVIGFPVAPKIAYPVFLIVPDGSQLGNPVSGCSELLGIVGCRCREHNRWGHRPTPRATRGRTRDGRDPPPRKPIQFRHLAMYGTNQPQEHVPGALWKRFQFIRALGGAIEGWVDRWDLPLGKVKGGGVCLLSYDSVNTDRYPNDNRTLYIMRQVDRKALELSQCRATARTPGRPARGVAVPR